MIKVVMALTAATLALPGAAEAQKPKAARKAVSSPAATAPATLPALPPSAATLRVAEWVAASADNRALPYAIIDKATASLHLFDAQGASLATVPVLIGIAPGDDATPGVGSKKLSEIGPAEKTTPAGRFLAKFGLAAGRQKVLWVDYANSVAIHPIPPDVSKADKRKTRMLSPAPDDNRITYGCINVPVAFYGKVMRPLFRKKGGYVYVLPDAKPLEVVFPRLQAQVTSTNGAG